MKNRFSGTRTLLLVVALGLTGPATASEPPADAPSAPSTASSAAASTAPSLAPAAATPDPAAATPDPAQERAAFDGTWEIDWDASEGVEAIMVAQGMPGLVRRLVLGSRLRQTLTIEAQQVTMKLRLPVGNVEELWVMDGQPRPISSRRGDHQLRAAWLDDGGIELVRDFDQHSLTAAFALDRTDPQRPRLVVTRQFVGQDGTRLASVSRFDRID